MKRDPLQAPPPLSERDRARLAQFDADEGFFVAGGDFPISPTMATILRYEPPSPKLGQSAKLNGMPDGEAQSLEEAMRR